MRRKSRILGKYPTNLPSGTYICSYLRRELSLKLETHIQDLLAVYKLAKAGKVSIDDVHCSKLSLHSSHSDFANRSTTGLLGVAGLPFINESTNFRTGEETSRISLNALGSGDPPKASCS